MPYDATADDVLARRSRRRRRFAGSGRSDRSRGDDRSCCARSSVASRSSASASGISCWRSRAARRTYKLPYGHRGGNQPVKDLVAGEVLVTAHNHGYAVDAASLPDELEATMTNLNDGTNEGFRHRTLPIAAVQFHPEASPGPFDARGLFAAVVRIRRLAARASVVATAVARARRRSVRAQTLQRLTVRSFALAPTPAPAAGRRSVSFDRDAARSRARDARSTTSNCRCSPNSSCSATSARRHERPARHAVSRDDYRRRASGRARLRSRRRRCKRSTRATASRSSGTPTASTLRVAGRRSAACGATVRCSVSRGASAFRVVLLARRRCVRRRSWCLIFRRRRRSGAATPVPAPAAAPRRRSRRALAARAVRGRARRVARRTYAADGGARSRRCLAHGRRVRGRNARRRAAPTGRRRRAMRELLRRARAQPRSPTTTICRAAIDDACSALERYLERSMIGSATPGRSARGALANDRRTARRHRSAAAGAALPTDTCCSKGRRAWPRRSRAARSRRRWTASSSAFSSRPTCLPSDIVGTRIFDQRESAFATVLGPIFANVVLADEINRAPAKVQSALLEAMQERQVTIGPQIARAARSVRRHGDDESARFRRAPTRCRSRRWTAFS